MYEDVGSGGAALGVLGLVAISAEYMPSVRWKMRAFGGKCLFSREPRKCRLRRSTVSSRRRHHAPYLLAQNLTVTSDDRVMLGLLCVRSKKRKLKFYRS